MNKSELVDELMLARENWKHQDFIDAYADEWDEIPEDISDCFSKMEEYIFHTYDEDYIKECIDNEIEDKDCYIGRSDIKQLAAELHLDMKELTKEKINYVINHFDSKSEADPTGDWRIWIEDLLLDDLGMKQVPVVKKELFFLYDMTTGELELELGEITQDEADNYEDGSLRAITEKEHIINMVIVQIRKDIADGDVTAIDELLKFVPIENLKGYLPE